MAQYHNYVWWSNQFKGMLLAGKGKMRPAKSEDEARAFVAFYEKRGGGCKSWKIPMQKAFAEAYGKPYMHPEEYRAYLLEQKVQELDRQVAEKEAALAAPPDNGTDHMSNSVGDGKTEGDKAGGAVESPPLTKAQFKEQFCKGLGYGSDFSLNQVENLKFGKSWKKYPNRIEE